LYPLMSSAMADSPLKFERLKAFALFTRFSMKGYIETVSF
jgi:hypothetical protein